MDMGGFSGEMLTSIAEIRAFPGLKALIWICFSIVRSFFFRMRKDDSLASVMNYVFTLTSQDIGVFLVRSYGLHDNWQTR
jgi:hypothetical protein